MPSHAILEASSASCASWQASAQQNNFRHPCRLAGCSRPRHRLEAWCRAHVTQAHRLGHPLATAYRSNLWRTESREVAAVLEANSDHPGLQQVLTFLTTFMAKAAHDSQAFRGAADVARLVSHGVTDRRVLEELCAAWAFMAWRPHALPSDAARDYLLARAVFALAPRPRRPCGKAGPAGFAHSYGVKPSRSALAYVGGHLRRALSPFLVNVYGQIERDRQQKTDPSAALMAPLRSSVTASPSGLPFPG